MTNIIFENNKYERYNKRITVNYYPFLITTSISEKANEVIKTTKKILISLIIKLNSSMNIYRKW